MFLILQILLRSLSNRIADFRLIRTSSPFDRRCTAMAWHPFDPNLVAVGSKGGDIILLDLENGSRDVFIQGVNNAVLSVKCWFCLLLVETFKSMHTDVLNVVHNRGS